jgi:ssDNA-binding replication factor A large subunit
MMLANLRPGMEHVNLKVRLIALEDPREVETNYGVTHTLVEGTIEDVSGQMGITVWNEKLELLERVEIGNMLELEDCFITSFKGDLSVNIGRESNLRKVK